MRKIVVWLLMACFLTTFTFGCVSDATITEKCAKNDSIEFQGEEPVDKLYRANDYIAKHADTVNGKYRMSYHVMPQIGWCNDPNGFCFFGGKTHLFYQYNPYSASWDTMHWGHVSSYDMVKWKYEPVALAPDCVYDEKGCFSGSAIVKDNEMYLMYTGVDAKNRQLQCLAVSKDGLKFEKVARNPVINEKMLGTGITSSDFRDPYVFKRGEYYYCLIGTKTNGFGNIALYRSKTLLGWEFVGNLINNSDPAAPNYYRLNGVYECPSFAEIDNRQILICSPQFLPQNGTEFQNIHSVIYMVGELDCANGRFVYDRFREIDGGFDFYAAQTTLLPDGRTVMTAWLQMWDRTLPTQADGWAGAMILPRELSYKNGRLYQSPVREIEKYRKNRVEAKNLALTENGVIVDGIKGDCVELDVEIEVKTAAKTGVKVFKGDLHETLIYYDAASETVVLDRSRSGVRINGAEAVKRFRSVAVKPENGKIRFRIFLDNTSCEVFVNGGYATLTANVYADKTDEGICFFAENGSATLFRAIKYDIIV